MQLNLEEMVSTLQKIRREQGEEAYDTARKNIARSLLRDDKGEAFARTAFPDLDFDQLKAEAAAGPSVLDINEMVRLIRHQMPNLKTDAQFKIFVAAFDALAMTLNCYFGAEAVQGNMAKGVLDQVLSVASQLPSMAEQVAEMPGDERSAAAASLVTSVTLPQEQQGQAQLLDELSKLTSIEELGQWYTSSRERFSHVTTQALRNDLFDAIRAKKHALAELKGPMLYGE
jgi:hypothetical protein